MNVFFISAHVESNQIVHRCKTFNILGHNVFRSYFVKSWTCCMILSTLLKFDARKNSATNFYLQNEYATKKYMHVLVRNLFPSINQPNQTFRIDQRKKKKKFVSTSEIILYIFIIIIIIIIIDGAPFDEIWLSATQSRVFKIYMLTKRLGWHFERTNVYITRIQIQIQI